eukprot:2058501-Ditylum_brightwellii.AAC.1
MKLTAQRWHTLKDDVRSSWKYRTKKLNKLPVPATFTRLPTELLNGVVVSTGNGLPKTTLLESSKLDWETLSRVFHNAIVCKPHIIDS